MKATKLTRKTARGASMLGQLAEKLAFRTPKPFSDEHAAEILDAARAQARIGLAWLAEHADEVLAELDLPSTHTPEYIRNGVASMLAPDADPTPLAHWAKGVNATKCEWSDKGARLVGAVNRKDVATIFGRDVEGYVNERAADHEFQAIAPAGVLDLAVIERACRAAVLADESLVIRCQYAVAQIEPKRTLRMLDAIKGRKPYLTACDGRFELRWGTGGRWPLEYYTAGQRAIELDMATGEVRWPFQTPWRKPQAYADAAE